MAKTVFTNGVVYIGGVDLSNHITRVTIDETWAETDTTAINDAAARRQAGLIDASISFDFQQDFASASIEQTINPLLGGTAPVMIWASGSTTGTANPKYTANVLCNEWHPIDASAGDLMTVSVTWPCDGTVNRAVA